MATTREQNERLTQVGPGTPMGNLLRRYWQPVGAAIELDREPVRKVRFFGEDLTLYRSAAGAYGLIERPLRAPLHVARVRHPRREADCAAPITAGSTTRPVTASSSRSKTAPFPTRATETRINVTAYPVQELGGLLFAYFGPQPAPLLAALGPARARRPRRRGRDPPAAVQLAAVHGQRRRSGALRVSARRVRQLHAQEARPRGRA